MERYEIKSLSLDDNEIRYLTFGSGSQPFVIIPGLSIKSVLLSANAVENAYREFGERYTVYLFDRRENLEEGVTVYDIAEDTAKAMSKLGIKNADVFGTSQGGMIAQIVAVSHPELVRKLALGSSAARLRDYSVGVTENWCALAKEGRAEELCRDFIKKVYSKAFAEKYGEFLVSIMSDCTAAELERFVVSTHASRGFDIRNELKSIKCPVLVLGAENDGVLTGEASEEIADILSCEIFMYGEPYGHAVYDEAEDYKQRLLDFFN